MASTRAPADPKHGSVITFAATSTSSRRDPEASEIALGRGRKAAHDKRWPAAIEQYLVAIVRDPRNAAARTELGFAYLKSGDEDHLAAAVLGTAEDMATDDALRAAMEHNLDEVYQASHDRDLAARAHLRSDLFRRSVTAGAPASACSVFAKPSDEFKVGTWLDAYRDIVADSAPDWGIKEEPKTPAQARSLVCWQGEFHGTTKWANDCERPDGTWHGSARFGIMGSFSQGHYFLWPTGGDQVVRSPIYLFEG